MTLEHSDFQNLFEKLVRIIEHNRDNPAAMKAIASELTSLYKKIPIYPGIIATSLNDVVKPAKLNELEKGAKVTILLKDGELISGEVVNFDSGNIKLKNCRKFKLPEESDEETISKKDIREVSELARDILAKTWPSLDFEVET